MKQKPKRDLISEATALVRAKGKASVRLLRDELKVGGDVATCTLDKLVVAGVIDKDRKVIPNHDTVTVRDVAFRPALDNAESGLALRKEAQSVEVSRITELAEKFQFHLVALKAGSIGSVNVAREIGLLLQAMCGHEQMSEAFWLSKCQDVLPFTFDMGKWFMRVSREEKEPIKTLDQAKEWTQPSLELAGLLTAPTRDGQQNATNTPLTIKFMHQATVLGGLLRKAMAKDPMSKWPRALVETFLADTEWLDEQRNEAVKLLKTVEVEA